MNNNNNNNYNKNKNYNDNNNYNRLKKIVLLGLYSTISLTIFMIEAAFPVLMPIPGIKLGLANIITLIALCRYGFRDALMVLTVRILMASFMAGQIVYLLYSVCGGLLSLLAMFLVNKLLTGKYVYITSIMGGIFHNVGQILAAYFVLSLNAILLYMPYLIISGIVTGLFTGLVAHYILIHLSKKNNPS